VFTLGLPAAAAGGEVPRTFPDVTIRRVPLSELPGQFLIAIQLTDPTLRPRRLRLIPPSEPAIEQEDD